LEKGFLKLALVVITTHSRWIAWAASLAWDTARVWWVAQARHAYIGCHAALSSLFGLAQARVLTNRAIGIEQRRQHIIGADSSDELPECSIALCKQCSRA
jgi:hypothetical protein